MLHDPPTLERAGRRPLTPDLTGTVASGPHSRRIVHRTRGSRHGPITRLMSPSDLGAVLKPFVFLDLFEVDLRGLDMPMHPHSGIATVTVVTHGDVRFHDPDAGQGTIAYGGVEWAQAGGGMWHGKELSPGTSQLFRGFQLWLALPPELENGPSAGQYLEAAQMRRAGPATVIIGSHEGETSPVDAPAGINYLLVTLKPGESWTYEPPRGHSAAWLALADGGLEAGERLHAGEMAVFDASEEPIRLTALDGANAVFVLGSALPHRYPLHLGRYSVHSSADALERGERRIAELGEKLRQAGERRTASGSVPVFR
jgi:redox-sensitive bicupin YhaK (pirin superfamily)